MKAQKTQIQTNPKGMDDFLSAPSPNSNQKTIETKPVSSLQETKPTTQKVINNKFEEIEQEIKSLEEKLEKVRTLEFSQFNKIVFEKKLMFRLLFITSKIYLKVRNNEGKESVVAVEAPRWGGSSLRYLLSTCYETWCVAVVKKTSKGEVIAYQVTTSQNIDIDDDIFD